MTTQKSLERTIANRWVDFGKWVKNRRLDLRMTQGEAGRKAGISRVHWARIESGDSGTKYTTIPLIAKALNVDVDIVYRTAGYAGLNSNDNPKILPEAVRQFENIPEAMAHFAELPIEIQRSIVKQVEALIESLHQVYNRTPAKK